MLKILNVLFDERVGGPQIRVISVANQLAMRGIETTVVFPEGDPQFRTLLRESQIPFYELDLVRPRSSPNPVDHLRFVAKFLPNVMKLCRLIREHHIDIVHTNGLVNFQAAIAARIENVELVWHLNDVNTPKFLQTLCLPFVRAWASKIAISSRGVAEYYFPDPAAVESRLFLLYPPVDTKNFAPARDRSIEKEVRREFGIDDDCPIIGTVANFDPTKRFECILEAAPGIKKKFPKAKFLFVGQKLENRRAYWDFLKRRTAELGLVDDVIFTGERRDIARLMRAMTVYAHPSESESCGMSVLEASASGLPVVAADSIGPRETVLQDVTGILVEANQPAQFANAVIRMLSDPEAARRMGAAGARRMHSLFSLENCVHEHMRLYFGLAHDESAFVAKSEISSSAAVKQFEDASARR